MRLRHLATAVTVVAVLATVATGCGSHPGSAGSVNPFQLVAMASTRTAQAKTARFAITVRMSGLPGAAALSTLSGQGQMDFAAKRGSLSMTLPGEAGQSMAIESVFSGTTIYERLPSAMMAGFPGGKSWIKIDLGSLSKTAGLDLGALSQGSSNDPSQVLNYLLGASHDVRDLGPATVRGVATHHYRATLDLTRAAQRLPANDRSTYLRMIQSIGSTTVPADVWIDAQGRARRMSVTMSVLHLPGALGSSGSESPPATVSETIDFYDFGTPVHIVIPAPGDVTDLSSLIGSLRLPTPTPSP